MPARNCAGQLQTEAAFQAQVIELARLCGWRVHCVWNARHSPEGWPDLFLLRGRRAIAAELKSERGRLTRAQREWIDALNQAGIPAFVFRPRDWGVIERILTGAVGREAAADVAAVNEASVEMAAAVARTRHRRSEREQRGSRGVS